MVDATSFRMEKNISESATLAAVLQLQVKRAGSAKANISVVIVLPVRESCSESWLETEKNEMQYRRSNNLSQGREQVSHFCHKP